MIVQEGRREQAAGRAEGWRLEASRRLEDLHPSRFILNLIRKVLLLSTFRFLQNHVTKHKLLQRVCTGGCFGGIPFLRNTARRAASSARSADARERAVTRSGDLHEEALADPDRDESMARR